MSRKEGKNENVLLSFIKDWVWPQDSHLGKMKHIYHMRHQVYELCHPDHRNYNDLFIVAFIRWAGSYRDPYKNRHPN